jgi:hypothetical protein
MAQGGLAGDGRRKDRRGVLRVLKDECGAHTSLAPLYAWSRKGARASSKVPRNWGANITNITLVASMSAEGMGPSLTVEGATTREVFEAYLEHLLVPALRPGQVVVMDNLSSHKGSHVRQLIEGRGCKLLYLPPYSPDLKARSRKPSRRSRHCCEAPQRVPVKPWSRRWAQH